MCNLSPAALDLTAEPERQDKCWQRTFPEKNMDREVSHFIMLRLLVSLSSVFSFVFVTALCLWSGWVWA